ncbi:circadian clock-controlled protein-like isoform X1 [Cimex lectularius]|nr:circadian clock-controlled protein-like isoform X1 [Cimex lectularius]
MLNVVFMSVVVLALNEVLGKKLPDFVPTCKRNDPNLDDCILKSIEVVRPHLNNGIPKIRVPALEPLQIPELNINRDLPNLKVKANLKDVKVYGASSFKINRLKTNIDSLSLEMSVTIPKCYVTTEYDVDGRLLLVPLKGKGLFKGNFTNIVADVRGTGELISNKKGVKYVAIKSLRSKVKVGDQIVKFVNTDRNPQNDLITQTAANFINQNRQQVLEIVTPIAEETADAIIKQMGNNVLRSIPYNELLPQ